MSSKELSIEEKKLQELRRIRYMLEDLWLSNNYVQKGELSLKNIEDRLECEWND